MNPVRIIMYVMNTILTVVNVREAQVLIPDIATEVGAMSVTGVWTLQVHVKKVMNPDGIIMYIVNTVHPTMNTTVQGITVHPVHVILEGLPVHIINTLLVEKMVSPVIIMS